MTNYRWFLLFIFIATVIWSAINPQSRIDWFLEALPVLIAAPVIILIARHFKLSDISYTLITIYMVLPLISSHYSVVGVSFGQWIGSLLHTTRNMYDRVTHFAFGVLWFYPIREMFITKTGNRNHYNHLVPLSLILSLGALYEIFEWVAAVHVSPSASSTFLGIQGDIFDAPKDMAVAFLGALIAMGVVFLFEHFFKNKTSSIYS